MIGIDIDPLERTRFHEAGHVVIYWELFADVAYHVAALHGIDDYGQCGTMGVALLPTINLSALDLDIGFYEKVMAAFYGGREAVAEAVGRGLLPNLVGIDPDEPAPGDRGFRRTSATAPSILVDEDWVNNLSNEAEARQIAETGLSPSTMVTASQLRAQAQDLAGQTLRTQWEVVERIVAELRHSHTILKLRLRDLLIGRF